MKKGTVFQIVLIVIVAFIIVAFLGFIGGDALTTNASVSQHFRFPWQQSSDVWLVLQWTSDLHADVPEPGKTLTFHSVEVHWRRFLPDFFAVGGGIAASGLIIRLFLIHRIRGTI